MEYKIKKCENQKCVTNHENYVKPTFTLVDKEKGKYTCDFCSNEIKFK
ncbi:aspartate carbamoyltransferase [uncultured Clostridium sp.]|nr:aspartate carbamoyltransferase [uncultured Clostridium sp.]